MDSFAVRTLRDIAHMTRLRGAETVIVGIQPEVAFAMVQLGLTLKGVATALDLEEGLAFLQRYTQGALRTWPDEALLPIAADVDIVERAPEGARAGGQGGLLGRRSDGDRGGDLGDRAQHPDVRQARARSTSSPGAQRRPGRHRSSSRATRGRASATSTRALQDGYSTSGGLGLGLPGAAPPDGRVRDRVPARATEPPSR